MPRICGVVRSEKFNSFGARWDVWAFKKGSTAKRICRPRLCIYSLNTCKVRTALIGFPVLTFVSNWVKFQTGIGTKVFTGGWKSVTWWLQTFVRGAKICNECQYAAHTHFQGQAFPTEKTNLVCFFRFKKSSALKSIQNFKICKNSQCKNSQISKSSKKQNS